MFVTCEKVQEVVPMQELTIESRFAGGNWPVQFLLYILEELSTVLRPLRISELLIKVGGAQSLRPRLFKLALLVPNLGLQRHRMTRVARVTSLV